MAILRLPDEVLLHIVQSLPHARQVSRVAQTCRRLRRIATTDAVWRPLVHRRFGPSHRHHQSLPPWRRRRTYSGRLHASLSTRGWKELYSSLLGWRRGRYHIAHLADSHPSPAAPCPAHLPSGPMNAPITSAAGNVICVASSGQASIRIYCFGKTPHQRPRSTEPIPPQALIAAPRERGAVVHMACHTTSTSPSILYLAVIYSSNTCIVYRLQLEKGRDEHAAVKTSVYAQYQYPSLKHSWPLANGAMQRDTLDSVRKCALCGPELMAMLSTSGRLTILKVRTDGTMMPILRFSNPTSSSEQVDLILCQVTRPTESSAASDRPRDWRSESDPLLSALTGHDQSAHVRYICTIAYIQPMMSRPILNVQQIVFSVFQADGESAQVLSNGHAYHTLFGGPACFPQTQDVWARRTGGFAILPHRFRLPTTSDYPPKSKPKPMSWSTPSWASGLPQEGRFVPRSRGPFASSVNPPLCPTLPTPTSSDPRRSSPPPATSSLDNTSQSIYKISLHPPYLLVALGHGIQLFYIDPGSETGIIQSSSSKVRTGKSHHPTVRSLWSAPTAHSADVHSVSLSLPFQRAISAGQDGKVHVWPLPSVWSDVHASLEHQDVNAVASLSVGRNNSTSQPNDAGSSTTPPSSLHIQDWHFDCLVASSEEHEQVQIWRLGGSE